MWSDGGANKKWAPRYNPDIVGTSLVHRAESSGLYWISKHYRGKKRHQPRVRYWGLRHRRWLYQLAGERRR